MSHNVEWRDVRTMFESMGEVVEEHNGNAKITRNGRTLSLRPMAPSFVADSATLMKIRHFIQSSHASEAESAPKGETLVVVIDHHEARVFRSEQRGSVPEKVVPYDPHGFGKHVHNLHDPAAGQHHPVPRSYFEDVAKSLGDTGEILLFGTGTGGGSAMNEFLDHLHREHRDLFERVVGVEVVDETHLTEAQLLVKAREFYADPLVTTV